MLLKAKPNIVLGPSVISTHFRHR